MTVMPRSTHPGPGGSLLSLIEHMRTQACVRGSKTALRDWGGALTYAELWNGIQSTAAAFRALGIAPGDRVGFALSPSIPYTVLVLGCMAVGGVACVLNTRLTCDEQERYLESLTLSLLISEDEHRIRLPSVDQTPLVLLPPDPGNTLTHRCGSLWAAPDAVSMPAEENIALIVPTGGTTGEPKGAMLSHRALWLWCMTAGGPRVRSGEDLELFFAPFFHVSLISGVFTSLFYGSTCYIFERFDAARVLELIEEGATHIGGTPTTYEAIRHQPGFDRVDRSRVRETGFGAMAATAEFFRQLRTDYPNARLRHAYGMTEAGFVTVMGHEDIMADKTGVGYVVPGAQVTLLDDMLRPVQPGEIGEITVRCPWAMDGYWAREINSETHCAYGFRTGDLGVMDETGWLKIAGRRKEMIITGGENVFPNEVENVLVGHPAIRELTVYGAKDDHWGERIEAAAVLQPGASLTIEELAEYGRDRLAGYKLPKLLRIVDAIPLTPANKPDRRHLSATA